MIILHLSFFVSGEFQAPPLGLLSRLQWIRLDTRILETMPRKTGGKKIILVRVDMDLVKQSVCLG